MRRRQRGTTVAIRKRAVGDRKGYGSRIMLNIIFSFQCLKERKDMLRIVCFVRTC